MGFDIKPVELGSVQKEQAKVLVIADLPSIDTKYKMRFQFCCPTGSINNNKTTYIHVFL
jgi:hypothetical protein